MAAYALTKHFDYFFGQLNPSPSFGSKAVTHYGNIKGLIESPTGPARFVSALFPAGFLPQ